MTIKFFYNGLKVNGGNLQRAHYIKCNYTATSGLPDNTITIYKIESNNDVSFTGDVRIMLDVENNSNSREDYFERDKIHVIPTNPLYAAVLEAWSKQETRKSKRLA